MDSESENEVAPVSRTPLVTDPVTLIQSPDPGSLWLTNPSLHVLSGGRVVVAVEQVGPGAKTLPGKKYKDPFTRQWAQTMLFSSNFDSPAWSPRDGFPMSRPCLFRDGADLYLMGDTGRLQVSRSADGGASWTRPAELKTAGALRGGLTQAPVQMLHHEGQVYGVAMTAAEPGHPLGAVVMKAAEGEPLHHPRSWCVAETPTTFRDLVPDEAPPFIGLPFFSVPHAHRAEAVAPNRWARQLDWQRGAQLVCVHDPKHIWHDAAGLVLHLLAPLPGHRSHLAVLARLNTNALHLELEAAPSGASWAFLPLPGGHQDFCIRYDSPSRLYWLAGNASRDSMRRAEALSKQRHGLPADELDRLELHFSRNLVDWQFAGVLDQGARPREARASCRLAIHGDDLYLVYCAGSPEAKSAAKPDRLVAARLRNFRHLAR